MSRVLIVGDHCGLSEQLDAALRPAALSLEHVDGHAQALDQLRLQPFSVVITNCESDLDQDLALLTEMRSIQPAVKCIALARSSTTNEVIAALKAHVFACYTPPFSAREIARVVSY